MYLILKYLFLMVIASYYLNRFQLALTNVFIFINSLLNIYFRPIHVKGRIIGDKYHRLKIDLKHIIVRIVLFLHF